MIFSIQKPDNSVKYCLRCEEDIEAAGAKIVDCVEEKDAYIFEAYSN